MCFYYRIADYGIIVNYLCPGIVITTISKDTRLLTRFYMFVLHLFAKTPDEGAITIMHCALSSQLNKKGGKFFRNCEESQRVHRLVYDIEARKKLWNISTQLTGLDAS